MIELPYAELHAFPDGDRPHSGNPAGVVLLDRALSDADLLGIAQSNNLSETAYLTAGDAPDRWNLRWFTPGVEVDLCGHATLASAAWLFETDRVGGDTASFETRSGLLTVQRQPDGRYAMNFPEISFSAAEPAAAAVEAVGLGAPEAAFEISRVHGARYQMLVFADETQVADMRINLGALADEEINLIVTAPGRSADFVSRFFAPASGVAEDPVTGSAHCTLAPYWAKRLGRDALTARQIGPRPGALEVRTGDDGRVTLIGSATRYLDGIIRL